MPALVPFIYTTDIPLLGLYGARLFGHLDLSTGLSSSKCCGRDLDPQPCRVVRDGWIGYNIALCVECGREYFNIRDGRLMVNGNVCSLSPETKDIAMPEPTWLSSHKFLAEFWPNQSLDPATIVNFRRPDRHDGWLEAIQGRMTADGAIDDSTAEIVRCLSPCVCGELLVNLAVYLRDAGYDILNERT